jgi:hypothetical protein
MSTTSDGGQLSPCVKLFIELLLQGDSGAKSSDVEVLRPEETEGGVVAHMQKSAGQAAAKDAQKNSPE